MLHTRTVSVSLAPVEHSVPSALVTSSHPHCAPGQGVRRVSATTCEQYLSD